MHSSRYELSRRGDRSYRGGELSRGGSSRLLLSDTYSAIPAITTAVNRNPGQYRKTTLLRNDIELPLREPRELGWTWWLNRTLRYNAWSEISEYWIKMSWRGQREKAGSSFYIPWCSSKTTTRVNLRVVWTSKTPCPVIKSGYFRQNHVKCYFCSHRLKSKLTAWAVRLGCRILTMVEGIPHAYWRLGVGNNQVISFCLLCLDEGFSIEFPASHLEKGGEKN